MPFYTFSSMNCQVLNHRCHEKDKIITKDGTNGGPITFTGQKTGNIYYIAYEPNKSKYVQELSLKDIK